MRSQEIRGQYVGDQIAGQVNDPYGTLDARGDGNAAFHQSETLFDEVEKHRSPHSDLTDNGLVIGTPDELFGFLDGPDAKTEAFLRDPDAYRQRYPQEFPEA